MFGSSSPLTGGGPAGDESDGGDGREADEGEGEEDGAHRRRIISSPRKSPALPVPLPEVSMLPEGGLTLPSSAMPRETKYRDEVGDA
jgi:hypothetical protein